VFTRTFALDAAERAAKTFAQTVVAFFGAGALNIVTAQWGEALSLGAGAAVLSVLTSVASSRVHNADSASLVDAPGKHAADRDR